MKKKIGKSQTQDQVYLEPGSWRPAVQQTSNLDRSFSFHPINMIFDMFLSFVYMYYRCFSRSNWMIIFDTPKPPFTAVRR